MHIHRIVLWKNFYMFTVCDINILYCVVVLKILHEGWCIKESGTQFLGKTNWKKRWFTLVQQVDKNVYLHYYKYKIIHFLSWIYFLHRNKGDRTPAGTIKLDVTCTYIITLCISSCGVNRSHNVVFDTNLMHEIFLDKKFAFFN